LVSTASIAGMIFSLLVTFLLPIGLGVYFYKKHRIYLPAIAIGALAFAVTQVFTRIPLLQWLSTQAWYVQMTQNTLLIALFLSITAGLFEETGRFIGYKYILKDRLEWKNGIAYGIGHGGFEAIAIVGLANINNLVVSNLINSGQVDSIGAALPAETLAYVTGQLINSPPIFFVLGGLERIMVIVIHIALSLIVLYGVMNQKNVYWLYAVLLHAMVNIPAVLFQAYSVWLTEGILFVMFVIALIFITKSRKWFTNVTV